MGWLSRTSCAGPVGPGGARPVTAVGERRVAAVIDCVAGSHASSRSSFMSKRSAFASSRPLLARSLFSDRSVGARNKIELAPARICVERRPGRRQIKQQLSLVTSDLDMTYVGNCCQCRFALENRHDLSSSCDPGHEPPMTTLPRCPYCSVFPRSRRSLLATLAGAATALVVPLHHPTVASPGSPDDEKFMRIAIEEARQRIFRTGR